MIQIVLWLCVHFIAFSLRLSLIYYIFVFLFVRAASFCLCFLLFAIFVVFFLFDSVMIKNECDLFSAFFHIFSIFI